MVMIRFWPLELRGGHQCFDDSRPPPATRTMSHRILPLLAVSALLVAVAPANAQTTVTTDPVGFNQVACPANSDTLLSIPFTRSPEFIGTVASVSASTSTVTVSGTQTWAPGHFVYVSGSQSNTYYALIGNHPSTNPNEGNLYPVVGSGSNTLTLNLNGDDISGVAANTQILVIPYWTLGTVFPTADANVSFVPSASTFVKQTQIQIPDYSATGINQSAASIYYFYNNAWRMSGTSSALDYSDNVILPNSYFVFRNTGTLSVSTTLTAVGAVPMRKLTVPIATRVGNGQSTPQDNLVAMLRPVPVTLNSSGLITSGAFAVSPSTFNKLDQLLVFDNTEIGINKSAASIYYYFNGAWRKSGQDSSLDFGSDTLPVGGGFVIRKGGTALGATQPWQHAPPY